MDAPVEYHECSECDGTVIYLDEMGECQSCGLGY